MHLLVMANEWKAGADGPLKTPALEQVSYEHVIVE